MGNCLQCQKLGTDEEIINKILTTTEITNIPVEKVYGDFLKCIIEPKSHSVDPVKFDIFIKDLIGKKEYSEVQYDFLFNISEYTSKITGAILILLSKGENHIKGNYLLKHYDNLYNPDMKNFLYDVIKINSRYCLDLFSKNLDKENYKTLNDVYSEKRMRKLSKNIMGTYEQVKKKYNGVLSKSMDNIVKNTNINKEFFNLSQGLLDGQYIRSWLYDDYLKDEEYKCNLLD